MSSVTTAIVASDEVAPAAVEKAPRRFPPPCWTQEEALALIGAYRERWYALRRGYLRTADWDDVAAAVTARCPGASPPKTSAQCRHKMEKLRQRYRAEKQRAAAAGGGRYFSSWFFFGSMEAMENGTTPPPHPTVKKTDDSSDGPQLKPFIDPNPLRIKLKSTSNPESSPNLGFDNIIQAKQFNSPYLNMENLPHDDFINRGMMNHMNRIPIMIPHLKSRSRKSNKQFNNLDGFHQQATSINRSGSDFNPINPIGVIQSNNGAKRTRSAVEEIVASINLLSEGFVRMEREKMEMAREMEAMRMEMEMKRNQMLLESQKQIVDAFLKGMFELKKSKKVKSGGVGVDSAEV